MKYNAQMALLLITSLCLAALKVEAQLQGINDLKQIRDSETLHAAAVVGWASSDAQTPWEAAADLGGVSLASAPASVSRTPSRIDVFYQGPNHHLWTSSWDGGPWWSGAADLGGVALTSDIAATSRNPRRIDLFYRGPNSHLWTSSWDGGPGWSAPSDLGGVALVSAPAAVSRTGDRIDVFYQGPNGHLWTSWWDGGPGWSAATDLGGVALNSAPAAVSRSSNRIDVFYKGPNGHLWTSTWTSAQGWGAPVDLGGVVLSSAPTAVARDNRIDVFFRGPNDHLWTIPWDGGPRWGSQVDMGTSVTSAPGGVTRDGKRLDVFYRGPNNHLWLSNWTPPVPPARGTPLSFLQPPPGSRPCGKPLFQPSTNQGTPIDALNCYEPRPGVEVWSIANPNVSTSAEVAYSPIQFKQFDVVSIAAGGCVQRGGSGFSWNRYVNPMDGLAGSDSLHYGSFRIPGITGDQRLLAPLRTGAIVIRSQPVEGGTLRLRYRDDGHGDNGYYGHDWGYYEQCRDLGNAWLVITIKRRCADAPEALCASPAPMDLVSSQSDPNNLLLNPKWGWQVETGVSPFVTELCGLSYKSGAMPEDNLNLCTRQSVYKDTNLGLCMKEGTSGRIAGHVNWTTATYTGVLTFYDHSKRDRAGDNDYNFTLMAEGNASHSQQPNTTGLRLEYNSSEVSDRTQSRWWQEFRSAVNRQDNEIRRGAAVHDYPNIMMGKRPAIVMGLVGIDCEHFCHVELHPVYAMAIHLRESLDDDVWVIFARNWGDEGYCSGSGDHPLNLTTLNFDLPAPAGGSAAGIKVLDGAGLSEMRFSHGAMTYGVSANGQKARVALTLRRPSDHSLVDGELHLRWGRGPG